MMKYFHPFRLDPENRCVWRADTRVPLSPRAFVVLRYLVEHPGRLLSQNELLDAAWRNLDVQPEILKKYILEIRRALGDQSGDPVYIETLPRLGYRFVATVHEAPEARHDDAANAALGRIVGRDRERAVLRDALAQAGAGRGGMLCLAGESGTGKTALAEEFLLDARLRGVARIVRGRCSEQIAGGEAYLPIWEALETSLGGTDGESLLQALRTFAPSWYAELGRPDGSAAVTPGAPLKRMPREFAALLQELARAHPLVLFLDDLHWADPSTIDLLMYLAGRLTAWRVLIIATYRPAELRRTRHPFAQLKLELQARGVCRKLTLALLSVTDTERYIGLEFAGHRFPLDFARLVHDSTEGNPLFMVELLRDLRERGFVRQTDAGWALAEELPHFDRDLPEAVSSMIRRKIGRLHEADRWLLCAAAVQGRHFDSAALAQVLGLDAAVVEERLVALEQQHALARVVSEAELPDGARTLCCCFVHALYHSALYASLTPSRRAALSAAVGALTRLPNEGGDAVRDRAPAGARRGAHEVCIRASDNVAWVQ
ncbi:MAG TPA: AAA family ATPase [Burkholderiales bacterium]|nr:AAA family ATPase [Burkholderiales bacterium]